MELDSSGVKPALEKVKKTVLGMAKNIAIGGAAVGGVGAALFAPIFSLFEKVIGHATEARKSAEQLGTTTEIFSGLGFAAKKAGVDTEGLVVASRHMQVFLSAAANGSGEAADALKRLGLDAKDLVNLPLDEQIEKIADGIAQLPNQADQAAAAMKIFGRSGVALLPVLKQGGQGIRDMMQDAKDFGLIVSTEEAAKAKLWTKAIGQLEMAFEGLKLAVGSALLEIAEPAKEWSDLIVKFVKQGREWVEENGQLILGIAAVGAALIMAGAALGGLAAGIAGAVFVVGALGTALSAVGTVLAAVFSPVGLGLATLAAAGALVIVLADDLGLLEPAIESAGVVLGGLLDTFNTTWQGMKDAIESGDLKLAFQVAVSGVDVVWKGFLLGLQVAWNEFKGAFVDGWLEMVAALKVAVIDLVDFLGDALPKAARDKLGLELGSKQDVIKNLKADLAARAAARQGDLFGAAQAWIDAQKNLADKVDQARRQNEGPVRDFRPRLFGGAAATAELAGTRGQFGGTGLGSALAIGDQSIPKKQLDLLGDIDDKLGDIKGNIGGLKVE